MKSLCLGLLLLAVGASAQTPVHVTPPPSGASRVVVLWPGAAPGAHGTADGDVPRLYVYPAAANPTHTAVIVMPGGGYTNLVMEKEGAATAQWLNEHGVTAFVLQYRLGPAYGYPAPILDGARAIRWVRSKAAELEIDKGRVGIWGFSAGGNLAGNLETVNDDGDPKAADAVEREGDRPDFAVIAYGRMSLDPGIPRKTNLEGLIGTHPTQAEMDRVAPVLHVTRRVPPTFLYATTRDQTVDSRNATAFYDVLQQIGVPVELHIFEMGPHGTGMGQNVKGVPEVAIWPVLAQHWMQMHGWMGE